MVRSTVIDHSFSFNNFIWFDSVIIYVIKLDFSEVWHILRGTETSDLGGVSV